MPRRKTANKPRKVAKKRAVKDPFLKHPDWSNAKLFGFIRSALRAAWSRYPPKYLVLAAAKRKYEGPNKRLKWEFQCNECKQYFPQKQISVDHIIPAGSLRSFEDIGPFCEKLFVGVEDLQVLCTAGCHQKKTARERDEKVKEKNK